MANLQEIFSNISKEMQAAFNKTAQFQHKGIRGSERENPMRAMLVEYLPQRYSIGSGEIVSPLGGTSSQCDVIICDRLTAPKLLSGENNSIYPIESIYGTIEVKSALRKGDLQEGYDNVVSVKKLATKGTFNHSPVAGMAVGMAYPNPVCGIVAYSSGRTLETIEKQLQELDGAQSDTWLMPDFIAVLDEFIILPAQRLRGDFNSYNTIPSQAYNRRIRPTKKHTLLRVYTELLENLGSISLPPLSFEKYLRAPVRIGQNLVWGCPFFSLRDSASFSFTSAGLAKIMAECSAKGKVTPEVHSQSVFGPGSPLAPIFQAVPSVKGLFEYNPTNKPPLSNAERQRRQSEGNNASLTHFTPLYCPVNADLYAIDADSLHMGKDLVKIEDSDISEFFEGFSPKT